MSAATRCKRVIIVSRVKRNPYVALLCEGLRQPDLGLAPSIVDHFSLGWMWHQRHAVDVLHIHWLELLFIYPSFWGSLKRWLSVMAGLVLARLCGVRMVYTLHNLWQHEGQHAALSWLGNRVIFALAQAVHVHDQETAEQLARQWGRRRGVHVIPHGNYVSAYRHDCTHVEARQCLQLADKMFVYLFLGRVRPYKGLEELLTAFKALADPEAALIVAGEVHEPGYDQQLRALAQGDERIRLNLQFVADDDLQVYLRACDVCVLPYRHVTTSGAAVLSFSFQVPIIAPRLGCFVSLVGQENERGILYNAQAPDGLCSALAQARQADLPAMIAACGAYAESLNWNDIARRHAATYS
jgi:beta-1,4-mannosyltransferase